MTPPSPEVKFLALPALPRQLLERRMWKLKNHKQNGQKLQFQVNGNFKDMEDLNTPMSSIHSQFAHHMCLQKTQQALTRGISRFLLHGRLILN